MIEKLKGSNRATLFGPDSCKGSVHSLYLEEHGVCGHDALEFRDGYSEFSPPLRTFCGNVNDSHFLIKTVHSTQTKLWIR